MNSPEYSPLAPLFRVCDGVRVRFADNKADSSAVMVLMLSPWPESLWAYRRIWDRVSGAARVVAIDLRLWPLRRSPGADRTGCDGHVPCAPHRGMRPGRPARGRAGRGHRRRVVLGRQHSDRVTSLTIGGGAGACPHRCRRRAQACHRGPEPRRRPRAGCPEPTSGSPSSPRPVPNRARRPRGLRQRV